MSSISTRSKTARSMAAESATPTLMGPPPPPGPPRTRTPNSTETKCAICLSSVVNKCKTDSCRHEFCFGCLLEWSKVKAECPLCKKAIVTIIHNIRSIDGEESHDVYHVPPSVDNFFGTQPQMTVRLAARFGSGRPVSSLYRRTNFEDYLESIIRLPMHSFGSLTSNGGHSGLSGHGHSHSHAQFGAPPPAHAASSSRGGPHLDQVDLVNQYHAHDPAFVRIVEMGPVAIAESRALNAFMSSAHDGLDNPFYGLENGGIRGVGAALGVGGDEAETGHLHALDGSEEITAISQSYQRRRRIYDREQYVSPFQSTLQAGTVFFPSVEYFRTHPTAYSRIKPWLKRELTILIGLTTARPTMAALYDLILSLLLRYDVRSREFREMIRIYFPNPQIVKHFQHEFYHFILSGMRISVYDVIAEYSSSRGQPTGGGGSGDGGPNSRCPPPVITIGDSDDEAEDSSDARRPGPGPRSSKGRRGQTSRCLSQARLFGGEEEEASTSSSSRLRVGLRRNSNGWSAIDLSGGPGPSRPIIPATTDLSDDSSDDCELLGIHPIIKPPPLAVITLDSDDDEVQVQTPCMPRTNQQGSSCSSSRVVAPPEVFTLDSSSNDDIVDSPQPSTSAGGGGGAGPSISTQFKISNVKDKSKSESDDEFGEVCLKRALEIAMGLNGCDDNNGKAPKRARRTSRSSCSSTASSNSNIIERPYSPWTAPPDSDPSSEADLLEDDVDEDEDNDDWDEPSSNHAQPSSRPSTFPFYPEWSEEDRDRTETLFGGTTTVEVIPTTSEVEPPSASPPSSPTWSMSSSEEYPASVYGDEIQLMSESDVAAAAPDNSPLRQRQEDEPDERLDEIINAVDPRS